MVKICPHLKPILEHEIMLGNKVAEVCKTWSVTEIAVSMKKKLDIQFAKNVIVSGIPLRIWENHDNHYALERGVYCDVCKHSIAGPL